MGAHTFRKVPPARYDTEGLGAGAPTGDPGAAQTAAASSASSNPLDGISGAVQGFLASGVSSAQVALGVALIGLALLMLVSQTSAGADAGRAAAGGARRGLRLIPGVGALA